MNETPAPSRRRGRPPKAQTILAPPQESVPGQVFSSSPDLPTEQAPTVPSPLPPLPAVTADDVDLRETPAMAAKHAQHEQFSGSDSKVRGAGDSYLPVEAGMDSIHSHPNPALPEQFHGATGTSVEADEQRHILSGSSSHVHNENPGGHGACPVEQSQALPVQERIPDQSPLTEVAPAAPVQDHWTPVQIGDVVQINSNRNKHFGTLFIIGDIENHRVHGYQIGPGGRLEYFTVNEDECILVGSMSRGQVRSRSACSAKWRADQR